ncbi:MAG: hypothetical protein ACOC22_00565 [bacterium]
MVNFSYLEKAEKTNSSNEKKNILKDAIENDNEIMEYLQLVFGDTIYNIAAKTIESALGIKSGNEKDVGERVFKSLSIQTGQKTLSDFGVSSKKYKTFDEFKTFLKELQELRGGDAKIAIKNFLRKCKPIDGKWYSRCLLKNLRSGINIKTVNKALTELDKQPIEKFELSLAEALDSNPKILKEQINKLFTTYNTIYSEPKYDGVRMLIRNTNPLTPGKWEAISRNGKIIETVDNILFECNRIFGNTPVELDGELIAEDFQSLMTQVNRKHDLNVTMPRKFMAFDVLRYNDDDMTKYLYKNRKNLLNSIIVNSDTYVIKIVNEKPIFNSDEAISHFEQMVNEGYEGTILKTDTLYTRDRKNWYKIKPAKTADLKVIGFNKGLDGKFAGQITSLIVEDKYGEVKSHVGSGLDDSDILMINTNPDEWLNMIVEVKFDTITKNSDGTKSLRFPRFIKFRDDKNEADAL